jgi:hypothetical protein
MQPKIAAKPLMEGASARIDPREERRGAKTERARQKHRRL